MPELTSASPREEQLLDVLQRVRLDAGAQPLPHDLEQVDEHLAAQELVDLLLARRVRAHQPRQRRRLVGRVVVDVHVRERAPALADEVDELLERAPLPVAVDTPRTARYVTTPSGSRQSTPNRNSSRAAGSKNGSPSMSKNTSPGDGAGRSPSPRRSCGGEQVVRELAGAVAVKLQRRLVAQPLEHRRREPPHAQIGRRLREAGERRHVDRLELADLVAPDRRDPRQVVVVLPALRGRPR